MLIKVMQILITIKLLVFNPDLQLKETKLAIQIKIIDLLCEIREFKFVPTLVLKFKKIESDDETKFSTVYSNLKTEAIINESDIYDIFESIYVTITSNI